jgi:hypothetical protein
MKRAKYETSTWIGFAEAALMFMSAPVSRGWYTHWGATEKESKQPLPGDEIVPSPKLSYTRAITIHAPAADVWRWLVQIGQGRGGLYSYDGLENLVGCELHSSDRILPQYQSLTVGDPILFGPEDKQFPGQVVECIQPGRALVMVGRAPDTRQADKSATWVFVLEEQADGSTRLLVRGRNAYAPGFGMGLIWHLIEPIVFVMERRMLRGIKARAEGERTSQPEARMQTPVTG